MGWSFQLSDALISIATSDVHESGARWYRSGGSQSVGQNSQHDEPAWYWFHGTFNPIYGSNVVSWFDVYTFNVNVGGKKGMAKLSIGGTFLTSLDNRWDPTTPAPTDPDPWETDGPNQPSPDGSHSVRSNAITVGANVAACRNWPSAANCSPAVGVMNIRDRIYPICQRSGQAVGSNPWWVYGTTTNGLTGWIPSWWIDYPADFLSGVAICEAQAPPPAYSKNTVRTADNHLVNFVRTTNNDLYSYDPLAGGWKLIGIGVVGEPQAIIHPVTGRVNVYVRDTQNQLLVNDLGGTGWSVIGIGIASNPSVLVHPATGRVNVYVRTTNNDLMVHDLGGTGWSTIGIGVTGNPTAATHPATGRVNVYTRVGTNLMVHDLGGTGWSTIGIGIVSDPVVAVHPYNSRVNVYVRNANNDLLLHDLGGTGWSTIGIGVIGTPTVGVHPDTGRVNVYVRNSNNDLLLHDLGGTGWSTIGIGVATDPTLIMGADRHRFLFATSTDHVLLRKDMDGPTGWTRHGMDIA
ncbi:hypothetical protein PT931_02675 [Longispora urticae]